VSSLRIPLATVMMGISSASPSGLTANSAKLFRGDERGNWHAGEAIWHWYDGASWGAIPSSPLKDNVWYHLAGSYDGKTLNLYLNGKLVGSKSTAVASGSMDTCIGCHPTPTNWWNGMIDEVAVFDLALTEEEINNIISYGLENMNPVSPSGKLSTTWGKIKR
ncbi:TPA: LamG domain-containing protein, partial [Candidatus Poribacteria bacterium]|nr:LamG domain-containing protein [Candidatus Poribacteria bacterium]